ncbi:Transmembrane protein 201 [Trichoplax sp. H2]|nr:Transmembrane protein 201 [Trichoplax sp. H2]|eukprot:RDD38237.1 Transmembrane protein 201 [Trichoplax sp. H2]
MIYFPIINSMNDYVPSSAINLLDLLHQFWHFMRQNWMVNQYEDWTRFYLCVPAIFFALFWIFPWRRRNCWFCNRNNWVATSQRNSWYCQFCSQYNGFNADGGYNKEINEMVNGNHEYADTIVMNRNSSNVKQPATPLTMRATLCVECYRKQEIIINQIAKFPEKYDNNQPFEAFKAALEKQYPLCKSCQCIVKRHLTLQNRFIKSEILKESLKKSMMKKYAPTNRRPPKVMIVIQFMVLFCSCLLLAKTMSTIIANCKFEAGIVCNYTQNRSWSMDTRIVTSHLEDSYIYIIGFTLNFMINFGIALYQIALKRAVLIIPLLLWIVAYAKDSWLRLDNMTDNMTVSYLIKIICCIVIVILNSVIFVLVLCKRMEKSKNRLRKHKFRRLNSKSDTNDTSDSSLSESWMPQLEQSSMLNNGLPSNVDNLFDSLESLNIGARQSRMPEYRNVFYSNTNLANNVTYESGQNMDNHTRNCTSNCPNNKEIAAISTLVPNTSKYSFKRIVKLLIASIAFNAILAIIFMESVYETLDSILMKLLVSINALTLSCPFII